MTHKAVVMAAGRGTRMRRTDDDVRLTPGQSEAADEGRKWMIPIDGRPFLDYVLDALASGGIREVCLIVAAGDRHIRRRYAAETETSRLSVTFAEQRAPTGTAHAILAARDFTGADDFLVLHGDNLYAPPAVAAMAAAGGCAIAAYSAAELVAEGNIPRERLAAFATIETDGRGRLRRIHEKPGPGAVIADDALISMNLWSFSTDILGVCERVAPSPRGEHELAGAVELAIREGIEFRVVAVSGSVLDLTERRDIARVAERLRSVTVQL